MDRYKEINGMLHVTTNDGSLERIPIVPDNDTPTPVPTESAIVDAMMFTPTNEDGSYLGFSEKVEIIEYEKFFVLRGYKYYAPMAGEIGLLPLNLHCYDFSDPTILPPPIIVPDIVNKFITQCVNVYSNPQCGYYWGGTLKCYDISSGAVNFFNLSHDNTQFMPNEFDPTILDIRYQTESRLLGNFEFTLYLAKEII